VNDINRENFNKIAWLSHTATVCDNIHNICCCVILFMLMFVGIKLLEGGQCSYYGSCDKVKALLSLCQVKCLVTSHEYTDWQSALSITSQVSTLTYV